jgi:NitT/TauT family transport system permease protein
MTKGIRSVGWRAGSIVVLLLLWWIGARLMHDPEVLPGPLVIGETIVQDFAQPGPQGQSAYFHIGLTLARIFAAFAASMILGIAIGLTMGLSRLVEQALLAIIPLMLTIPTILMVFLAVMWFFEGAKAMDKSLIEMGMTFKARRPLLIRKVYLPQLMPYIFSAFRYAFGVTWKIVALAETFGLKYGIGYMFFFWFGQFNMEQVLAWIIMFVVLMLILEHGVFARLESRAFAWRASIAH